LKEVLNKIIKFITSKGVKKFFAREFLILLLGVILFLGFKLLYINPAYNAIEFPDCMEFTGKDFLDCMQQELPERVSLRYVEEDFAALILILLYGTRILYQFFRFIKWCFRVVFFDK